MSNILLGYCFRWRSIKNETSYKNKNDCQKIRQERFKNKFLSWHASFYKPYKA